MSRPATAAQGLAPTTDRTTRAPKAPDTPLAPATTAPGARADRIGDAVTGPTAAPLPGGSPTGKRPVTPGYLQAKLAVSRPQDAEEREADRVAGEVSRALRTPTRAASAPDAPVRRGEAPRGSLEPAITPPRQPTLAPKLMRQPRTGSPAGPGLASTTQDADAGTGAADVHQAPAATEQRIAARRGQGAPLEPRLRAQLESRLGRDLSAVRIHTDAEADAMCTGMLARAFTVGNDIYFSAGSYAPASDSGLELLAHELAHVGQQADAGGLDSAEPKLQRDFWDTLFGGGRAPVDPMAGCRRELDAAEEWATAGPYPAAPRGIVGAGGIGGFDAQYRTDPVEGDGVLAIEQGVAAQFKDTLVQNAGVITPHPDLPSTPEIRTLASRMNAIPVAMVRNALLARYQWTAAEQAPWLVRLEALVETTWGGRHSFFLNKPRWNWLGAEVSVDLDIGQRAKAATDHLVVEIYKTPPGESLRSFDISHEVGSGSTTDPADQTMRLASTTAGPKEYDLLRQSVEFDYDSDVLTGTAIAALNGFITRFNGAVGNAAHQEVRVEIVGHTSAAGSERYNLDLSRRRAEAVRTHLERNGFANTVGRVRITSRGEAEADPTQPRRASDQRAELVVDGGERMVTAAHEWGHAFGLDDEYVTGGTRIGDPVDHDAMTQAMTDADGVHLPGAIKEHNGGIMSFGNEVRPQHYATFHHALATVTAQSPWALGLHKPKWQVAMECGAPSPPGDWPVPARPPPGAAPTHPAPGATPGGDDGNAVA